MAGTEDVKTTGEFFPKGGPRVSMRQGANRYERAPWLTLYLAELMTSPNGNHDDQVDSTAQMLDWFKGAAREASAFGVLQNAAGAVDQRSTQASRRDLAGTRRPGDFQRDPEHKRSVTTPERDTRTLGQSDRLPLAGRSDSFRLRASRRCAVSQGAFGNIAGVFH